MNLPEEHLKKLIKVGSMIITPEEARMTPKDLHLRKRIYAKIQQHYPEHVQFIKVTVRSGKNEGIIEVKHLGVSGEYGFCLPLSWLVNDPNLNQIMVYTGEFLERYKLSREKSVDIISELSSVKRNNIGRAVHEQ
jgi:hypothetical protein